MKMDIEFPANHIIDNTTPISELCKNSYALADLYSYFGDVSPNEALTFGSLEVHDLLVFNEVDSCFPIECIRQSGPVCFYSVYRVNEGGYFYLFWGRTANVSQYDPVVSMTTYIPFLPSRNDYRFVQISIDTGNTIANISTAVEFNFAASSAICSYTLLDDGYILETRYKCATQISSLEDLVITSMRVLPKHDAQAASYLAWIKGDDLP